MKFNGLGSKAATIPINKRKRLVSWILCQRCSFPHRISVQVATLKVIDAAQKEEVCLLLNHTDLGNTSLEQDIFMEAGEDLFKLVIVLSWLNSYSSFLHQI